MYTPEEIGILLARSSMPAEEREVWLKLVPFLSQEKLVAFAEMLESQTEKFEELRTKYLSEIRETVRENRVERLKRNLS